jgi:hypothetical protein
MQPGALRIGKSAVRMKRRGENDLEGSSKRR